VIPPVTITNPTSGGSYSVTLTITWEPPPMLCFDPPGNDLQLCQADDGPDIILLPAN
jgi:hypothetical protein